MGFSYNPILVIGINGSVCLNWNQWGGSGFGGTVCPDCGGAPPRFSGKHASRCTCCNLDHEGCEGYTGIGCSLEFHDVVADPSDCRGGFAKYAAGGPITGSGSTGSFVEVAGTGTARAAGLVGPFPVYPNGGFIPMRIGGKYQMRWSCGTYGDVVKGRCVDGWNGPMADGVCMGGADASVNLESLGYNDSTSSYDCPCNCMEPLGRYCDVGAWWAVANCSGGVGTGGCCEDPEYCWQMAWEPSTIKGALNHSLGRDKMEMERVEICCESTMTQYGEGRCCSRHDSDTAGPALTFGGCDPLDWAHDCPCGVDEMDDYFLPCPDRCEDGCEPAGLKCGDDSVWEPDGCTHCPQLLNVLTGSSCWDCIKPRICDWGDTGDIILDPIVIQPMACYMPLSVSVSVDAGECAVEGHWRHPWDPDSSLCGNCYGGECDEQCEDDIQNDPKINIPNYCAWAGAGVWITSA